MAKDVRNDIRCVCVRVCATRQSQLTGRTEKGETARHLVFFQILSSSHSPQGRDGRPLSTPGQP